MQRLTRTLLIGAGAVWLAAGSYGVASAAAGQGTQGPNDTDGAGEEADSDTPLAGNDLDRAVAAALEHTGGGEVTETEVGDDGAAYGVEIRLADGSQVEVNLDTDFAIIGSEADDD